MMTNPKRKYEPCVKALASEETYNPASYMCRFQSKPGDAARNPFDAARTLSKCMDTFCMIFATAK